jgi:hypothetical protein
LHTVADPHREPAVRQRRRRSRGPALFLLLLALLAGAILYPPTFLFGVRQLLMAGAMRYGFQLSIGKMDGSASDPIRLENVRLGHKSEAGTSTMLQIDDARASFDWKQLFTKRSALFWQSLTLDGVRGEIHLPAGSPPQPRAGQAWRFFDRGKNPRLVLPSSLTVSHAEMIIHESRGLVRLEDVDLQASDVEAGRLLIGAISVQTPWMTSVYSNCRGSLLLQDSRLILAGMKLTDALSINSASADLPALLRGELQMNFSLDAFSGSIDGELRSIARPHHLDFEGDGTFSNISVAQLAAFFGQDADGSIKQGKFTFRGSPRELARATFTTRFEAGAFRWGPRRWNSLVAGATYVHHHLEHLEFQLTQAKNSLMLNGDMNVPDNWKEWWKTDFSFVVAAKIDSLSDLSALLGPAFGDIFGKLTVDGSVRGENASFNGQLIVSGSRLSFRKAPLDELQAAIKLDGNEIQVTNAEFTHGDDFLRGEGVVNILGEKRYWGEIKASIADLAVYASFLQPPIAPGPFTGGLVLDWSGDGAEDAHSGAFTVRLNHVRPLATEVAWQPVDVNAEATYSPESIFFSNLSLGNGDTSLVSRVVATPRSLTLQGVKVLHGKSEWLAGDAQIPLNVWAAWLNPGSASWWNFESPCKMDLKLDRLSVHDTLLLSGREQPFDGEATGEFKSDGTLAKLAMDGHLSIRNAAGSGPGGALKDGDAALDFKGGQVTVTSGSGKWNGIPWSTAGTLTAPDVRTPFIHLAVTLPAAPFTFGPGVQGTAALGLLATGAPRSLALSGSAQLGTVRADRTASIESLLAPGGIGLDAPLPAPSLPLPPGWILDIQVAGSAPASLLNTSGTVTPSITVTGSAARPVLSGRIDARGFQIVEGTDQLSILDGSFFLNPTAPADSRMVAHVGGAVGGYPFDGRILGTITGKQFTWGPVVTAMLTGKPIPRKSAAPLRPPPAAASAGTSTPHPAPAKP